MGDPGRERGGHHGIPVSRQSTEADIRRHDAERAAAQIKAWTDEARRTHSDRDLDAGKRLLERFGREQGAHHLDTIRRDLLAANHPSMTRAIVWAAKRHGYGDGGDGGAASRAGRRFDNSPRIDGRSPDHGRWVARRVIAEIERRVGNGLIDFGFALLAHAARRPVVTAPDVVPDGAVAVA